MVHVRCSGSTVASVIPLGIERSNKFKSLLICRIFRPDRVVNAIKRFIIDRMKNEFYVKSPPIVYKKVLQ